MALYNSFELCSAFLFRGGNMKIAICDDIKEYRLSIRTYTEAYFNDNYIPYEIVEFENGAELLNSSLVFDIVFLDIELGDLNGIDVAKHLRKNKNTIILVTTSYIQYLDAAMDLHVLRFINKPITQQKIFSALSRAQSEINEKIIFLNLKSNSIIKLSISEIVYIEARIKKVNVFTCNNIYTVKDSLKTLKTELTASYFAVPHNSYIVNMNYINSFKRDEITLTEPYNNVKISIATRKQPEFKRKFLDYIGEGDNE